MPGERTCRSLLPHQPLTAYRQLLSTTVTSTRTHFSDFKRQHAKDARFREFGKMEGEREKEFKKWLRELGERKRAEAERAEREFGEMLRLDGQIKSGDKWAEVRLHRKRESVSLATLCLLALAPDDLLITGLAPHREQVKKRHASDPRYAAVNSSSLREQLFEKHLASLASSSGSHHPSRTAPVASTSSSSTKPAQAPSKEDKAARAAASLREREEKVRLEKMRNARSAERARGHLGKDEAEREFAQLLVDAVRDHNVSLASLSLVALVEEVFPAPASATSTYTPM
jgi:transcription elongation regulator 1